MKIINNILNHQEIRKRKRFVKFALVGFSGMIVDLTVLYLLVEFFAVHYLVASVVSFLLAVVNNFLLNKYWTFEDKNKRGVYQFFSFLLISLCGLVLNLVIMYLLVDLCVVWYILAKVIAIFLVTFWNYFMNKKITFGIR
jgi:putative flippase GtrA